MKVKLIPTAKIAQRIHFMHGKRVMLDRDLAQLYGVETRALNQAVRRNRRRFPADFMFELTRQEIRNISQIVISSGIKHAPKVLVFTEQGVAMLSSVLHSERAVRVNIAIMRAFVQLRDLLDNNRELARRFEQLETRVGRHDGQITEIIEAIRQLLAAPPIPTKPKQIGFHVRERPAKYKTR